MPACALDACLSNVGPYWDTGEEDEGKQGREQKSQDFDKPYVGALSKMKMHAYALRDVMCLTCLLVSLRKGWRPVNNQDASSVGPDKVA